MTIALTYNWIPSHTQIVLPITYILIISGTYYAVHYVAAKITDWLLIQTVSLSERVFERLLFSEGGIIDVLLLSWFRK